MSNSESETWQYDGQEFKRTESANGELMFFIDGTRISNSEGLEILDEIEGLEKDDREELLDGDTEEETSSNETFTEKTLKGKTYKIRSKDDEDKILTVEFDTVKVYPEFILGERENQRNLLVHNVDIVEGEV